MDCLFCSIANGEIPAHVVFSDEQVVAFRDIAPVAPSHLVVIPREHHADIAALSRANAALSAHLLAVMSQLGAEHCPDGFRLVFNTGADGGQTVGHVHGHVVGGRSMTWPPG